MLVRYSFLSGIVQAIFGGGPKQEQQYFNSGPSAAEVREQERQAAEAAKNKSMADQANRQGAASSLITAADSGSDFGALKTRKTLLGGA